MHLAERPLDSPAIVELSIVSYNLEEFGQAAQLIKRTMTLGDVTITGKIWVNLAKCYFRKWYRDRFREGVIFISSVVINDSI